jgi:Cd2+/Zn2+-exporting ATPase/Cu+-exporting ATPase
MHDGDEHRLDWVELARTGLVAVAVLASWLHPWRSLAQLELISLVATIAGGYPIWKEAFEALLKRRMTMELSMTIAIGAALAIRESITASVIVLFVLVAEVLEHQTVGRGRRAIRQLTDLLPRTATVRSGRGEREVDSAEIKIGDLIVVKPGSRLPVDGQVSDGHSFVDQATITGESLPVEKRPGNHVFAGTINQSGALIVRASGIGRDTAFGKIIEAVEHAEQSRAPIQKTADRLAGYLVYFALACAAFTFLVTRDARSTISVVIVAGACGIAAGTPLAILGAIGRAARLGAIVKGGLYLEELGHVDTIVLDKTGTLTLGVPEVVAVRPLAGVAESELLVTAGIAEMRSEHPLAKAILSKVTVALPEPDRFKYTPGMGIICSSGGDEIVVGNRAHVVERGVALDDCPAASDDLSEVLVARGGRLLGAIHIADVLRPEAAQAVAKLRAVGFRTLLVTGDSPAIASSVGEQLGVDEVNAGMLPVQKLERVKALMSEGRHVAMVGDGVNDAPALMQASVGIAMGSGTDVARESANVVLIGNDLMKLVETLEIARRCRRIIRQNFVGTLIVDGTGVALAAFGFLNPLLAAFIHVSSELAFILNSTRLLPNLAKPSCDRRGSHLHGPGCGHEAVAHDDHVDYAVGGHLHHMCEGRCDDHGPLRLARS